MVCFCISLLVTLDFMEKSVEKHAEAAKWAVNALLTVSAECDQRMAEAQEALKSEKEEKSKK